MITVTAKDHMDRTIVSATMQNVHVAMEIVLEHIRLWTCEQVFSEALQKQEMLEVRIEVHPRG